MIQLHVLRGSLAGESRKADIFPFTVGRDAKNSFTLTDAGVFDRHFEIRFTPEGFALVPHANVVVTLNGERSEGVVLRNGDVVGVGLAQIQFWLGALPQRGLRLRESATWALVLCVLAAQAYLFWRLLKMAR